LGEPLEKEGYNKEQRENVKTLRPTDAASVSAIDIILNHRKGDQ